MSRGIEPAMAMAIAAYLRTSLPSNYRVNTGVGGYRVGEIIKVLRLGKNGKPYRSMSACLNLLPERISYHWWATAKGVEYRYMAQFDYADPDMLDKVSNAIKKGLR